MEIQLFKERGILHSCGEKELKMANANWRMDRHKVLDNTSYPSQSMLSTIAMGMNIQVPASFITLCIHYLMKGQYRPPGGALR